MILARTLLAACLATFAATLYAKTESCQAATEQQIASLFDRWNASLATGDPKKVVANYATKSILLPTVSNKPRLTPEEKLDYFQKFLKKKPQGMIDSRFIEIDCNTALDAGIYTFKFGADGSTVQARYTYTYKWNGKDWLITSHHSSAMPEK
ncbi:MAG TPA: SgcJ/EcaC family oxidoreductase [Usitatibacter sp.]|nr:SgcJ/EcaC family oxidoreductase [Usitatibacter sp.]